jgi:hypothetical protein
MGGPPACRRAALIRGDLKGQDFVCIKNAKYLSSCRLILLTFQNCPSLRAVPDLESLPIGILNIIILHIAQMTDYTGYGFHRC